MPRRPCDFGSTALAIAAACAIALAGTTRAGAAVDAVPEYALKAAVLYNFQKFVTWPDDVPASAPLRIVVVGPEALGLTMQSTLSGKRVGGRPISVRALDRKGDTAACDVLYFAKMEDAEMVRLLREVANRPILTVGETHGFLEAGGMVRFELADQKIRIHLNLDATDQRGLHLDPSLLSIASTVRTRRDRAEPGGR